MSPYTGRPEDFGKYNPWRYWVARFNGASKIALLVSLVTLGFVAQGGISRVESCQTNNLSTIRGNARGAVLKDFLLDAATARQSSVANDKPAQAVIDQRAADRYLEQAAKLHGAPTQDCKYFGVFQAKDQ